MSRRSSSRVRRVRAVVTGRRVPRWVPDVPSGLGPMAERSQEVHGKRGRRALALGARDAGDPARVGFLHEEAEAPAHGDSRPLELVHLGTVATDPRALDHDLTARQCFETSSRRRHDREAFALAGAGRVVDQHRRDPHDAKPANAGPALDAETPDADRRVSECGPGDRLAHSGLECGGRRAAGAGQRHRRRFPWRSGSSDESPTRGAR